MEGLRRHPTSPPSAWPTPYLNRKIITVEKRPDFRPSELRDFNITNEPGRGRRGAGEKNELRGRESTPNEEKTLRTLQRSGEK